MDPHFERTPRAVLEELKQQRNDLAFLEHEHLRLKVSTFVENRDAKTVKEMEYLGDYAALGVHKDLQLMRARVRSLEDELEVALHGT